MEEAPPIISLEDWAAENGVVVRYEQVSREAGRKILRWEAALGYWGRDSGYWVVGSSKAAYEYGETLRLARAKLIELIRGRTLREKMLPGERHFVEIHVPDCLV